MANIHSQKKRNARTQRERAENLRFTSRVKTHMRGLRAAVEAGDDASADEQQRLLHSAIDRAVKRGAIHANNGARKKARAARIRAGARV